MKTIKFNDTTNKAELGDTVELQAQTQEVVRCQVSNILMLNIDAENLQQGDLSFIKALGLTISNPETEEPIALGVEMQRKSVGRRISEFFEPDNKDDNDDSSFFSPTPSSSGSFFGGSSGFGGFGGFGGGSFGGGGASRGW